MLCSAVSSAFAAFAQMQERRSSTNPEVVAIPPPQSVFPNNMFSLTFSPTNLFSDTDSAGLTIQAVEKGKPTLPTWMNLKIKDWSLLGSFDTSSSNNNDVQVVGQLAFVATSSSLQIINITNPTSPILAGSYSTGSNVVYVVDNLAYIANSFELEIIDISNLSSPTIVGNYAYFANTYNLQVADNFAYLSGYSNLKIIDVSTPSSPTLVSDYVTPGSNIQSLHVVDNKAYVADGFAGLSIIDVSNPYSPTLVGNYTTPDQATGVYITGNMAFVVDNSPSLQIIDVSNSSSPSLAGSYITQGTANDVYVVDNMVYLAEGSFGLEIIDIENLSSPVLAGNYDTLSTALAVHVIGSRVYATDSSLGLHILDPKFVLSGIPDETDIGNSEIDIIAIDPEENQASLTFTVRVEGPPVVGRNIPVQIADINAPFSYFVNQEAFQDPNSDIVFQSARLSNQNLLPSWLMFSPIGIFSGTPQAADKGNFTVEISAFDGAFTDAATTTFSLIVEHYPEVSIPLPKQAADINRPYSFTIPPGTFTDADVGDVLTFATSTLPSWLNFNPNSLEFSGTPTESDEGIEFIDLHATDPVGATTSTTLKLEVGNFPDLLFPVPDQIAAVGLPYIYAAPGNTFSAIDGSPLSYHATKSDGSPLPNWLEFDKARIELQGTPLSTDKGVLSMRLVAEDPKGGFAESFFQLNVASPLSEEFARIGGSFVYPIPENMISNPLGPVTYTVTLGDFSPLPSWMRFDPNTNAISGVPPNNAEQNYNILITADDGLQAPVLGAVSLKVGQNTSPQVANQISNQIANVGQSFRFVIPDNTFIDPNNDPLTLSASRANGRKLPGWLRFQDGTLDGKPGASDTNAFSDKTIPLQACASDGDLEICSSFNLSVQGTSQEEKAISILIPLSSMAALSVGWAKKRGLLLNPLNREKYDKGTITVPLNETFSYSLLAEKSKIVRIQAFLEKEALFGLSLPNNKWAKWLMFDKPITGGALLPNWLKYDLGKNELTSRHIPNEDNVGLYTIRVYGSGDVIVEEIQLNVGNNEKE